ncbi:membrane dipeptidase [Segetibacter sp. 3557_3]|uniref:dipeptidase n=1 Tax=Segetibacter sp. 3557_3 TaxID=2547429 RepID=UPI0010589786|nr:dipeptidase [Segetibacter sp. 3557_3]TDH29046.1 membrane dipeptidase [Segetibacter sp. 3557_3]
MRFIVSFLISMGLLSVPTLTFAQPYIKLHRKAVLIDTHNDVLEKAMPKGLSFDHDLKGKTQSDLTRFGEGGMDIQIFSIWCDGNDKLPFGIANRQIDTLYTTAARNKDRMLMVTSPASLRQALRQKKLGAMIGVEGGHMIENDLAKLQALFDRGARYLTLTHNVSTPWATSAWEETHDSLLHQPKGLNDLGRKVVEKMNQLGMLVDVSHVGEQTFYDIIKLTSKPIIASHSSVYQICPVPRNLKDEQIKAIAKNGGVIHINFYSGFLDSTYDKRKNAFIQSHKAEADSLKLADMPGYRMEEYIAEKYAAEADALRAPLSAVIDHIDYIVKLVGINHVGIGSDFDGIESSPRYLDGVQDFPIITRELLARGYRKKDIQKILGANFIRVFKANMP